MFQWLMAKYYDKFMKDAEERGLRDWRRAERGFSPSF